jgi:hypothetical protein
VGAQQLGHVVCGLRSFPASGSGLSSAHCQSSCPLFTDGSLELGSLPLPSSLVCFQQPPLPLLCTSFQFHCLLFSFLFFFLQGGSVCLGELCCFIPGVAEGYYLTLGDHMFGLPKVSQACLELAVTAWGWQPACSLSVLWCGEAFHGQGVQGAKVSTLSGASPLPSVAPASQPGP